LLLKENLKIKKNLKILLTLSLHYFSLLINK